MVTRSRRPVMPAVTTLLLAVVAVTAHGQSTLPEARTLVDRYVAAIGGEAAHRSVSSLRVRGTTELPVQNFRGTFEMISARPSRLVLRMDLEGIGMAESGYNGEVGWTLDPMAGPSLLTGAPLAEVKNDAHFDAALHPPDLVATLVTVARVEFDGRQAYKVAVTYVGGQQRDEFFDVESGLLLGSEGVSETPMGKVPTRVMLRDYRAYGSLRQPSRIVQTAMGIDQHFRVESVETNSVQASAFEPPAVVRAIIKSEPEPEWRVRAVTAFDEVWTTVHDTFHDPSFGGLDWSAVREELRPRVRAAGDQAEARRVIREMLGRLGRSHFDLLSADSPDGTRPPAGDARVPIDVRRLAAGHVITRVSDGSTAARAGLRAGQVIVGVDGVMSTEWERGLADLESRTAAMTAWRRVLSALGGADGSEAVVRVRDDREERDVRVKRVRPSGDRVVLGDLPPFFVAVEDERHHTPAGKPVGLIRFNVWMTQANEPISLAVDRYREAHGLIFDLRGNPGGLAGMIQGVAGHLVTEREVLGRMATRESELTLMANPRVVMSDGRRVTPFGGPVAVLVDELTASTSECFAGGLQSLGRARIFGRTTAGQALPASTRRLANGDLLMYAVGDFVTGNGRRIEGAGVVPDQPVLLDPAVLSAGRDPDLEAALRWLDGR